MFARAVSAEACYSSVATNHPLAAMQAAELQKWAAGPDYAEIFAENYPRRSDDKEAPISEDVKSAANSCKQNFTTSADPLYKLVGKIGSVAGVPPAGLQQTKLRLVADWSGRRVHHVTLQVGGHGDQVDSIAEAAARDDPGAVLSW